MDARVPASGALTDQAVIGGWAFRNRSWLPVPLGLVLLALSWRVTPMASLVVAGIALVAVGQVVRFWAVRHIGAISRTRAQRTGPLIISGPYALVRNPLYVGNWCMWTGVVLISGVYWMLPVAWLAFRLQYGEIIAWEERVMEAQFPFYRKYAEEVPRWVPRLRRMPPMPADAPVFGWGQVLRSERGTLIAVVSALLLFGRFGL